MGGDHVSKFDVLALWKQLSVSAEGRTRIAACSDRVCGVTTNEHRARCDGQTDGQQMCHVSFDKWRSVQPAVLYVYAVLTTFVPNKLSFHAFTAHGGALAWHTGSALDSINVYWLCYTSRPVSTGMGYR